jgi:hypothetical protein
MILKISIEPALPNDNRSNVIIYASQSIDPGAVGRVRLRSIEFSDIDLHKPAPTDPKLGIRSINCDQLKWFTNYF